MSKLLDADLIQNLQSTQVLLFLIDGLTFRILQHRRAEIWLSIIGISRQVSSTVSIGNLFIHTKKLLDPTQFSVLGDNKPLLLFFISCFRSCKAL